MADWWKLKREAKRFGQQLRAIPEAFWEPIAKAQHDKTVKNGLPTYAGDVDFGPKVALVLMYQPDGLRPSMVHMCKHLKDRGFSVQIISNSPVTPDIHTALKPYVWHIVERPNFGYDFGGYRDGLRLLHLHHGSNEIESLLMLNDSIWYPVRENDDLIEQLEALDADIAGTNLRQRGNARFLESYLYLIRGSALRHDAFRRYWNNLKITSNKYKVIRRGERGFSTAMQAAGLTLRGLYDTNDLLSRLDQQSDDFLRKTLLYSTHSRASDQACCDALLAAEANNTWRREVMAHVRESLTKDQIYSAFPYASQNLHNYAILKKSRDRISRMWREAVIKAVDAGDLPPPLDVVLTEMHDIVAGR